MMDLNNQPYLSNEQGTEFQTFGSSSQPRKISIGILMDSFTELRPKDVTIQTEENAAPPRANYSEDGKNMQGLIHSSKLNQLKPVEHETSPWLRSRSFPQKLSMSEQVHSATPAPIFLATTPISEVHNRVRVAKDGTTVGVEKIPLATQKCSQEEEVEKRQTNKAETRGSETLRMKLWEILETISSPNKQLADEHGINMEAKNMSLLQNNDEEFVPVAKLRQNSDTIETDSECLDLIVGRPMTRSLTRRKAAVKLKASEMENSQYTYSRKETKEENNFPFKEGFSRRPYYGVSGGSLTLIRKRSKRWKPGTTTHIMCSHELENPGQNQSVKSRGKKRPSHEKSLLHANGGNNNDKLHQRKDSEFNKPKSVALEIDSHQIHVNDVPEHQRDIVNSSKLKQNVDPAGQKLHNHSFVFGVKIPEERHIPDYSPNKMKKPSEEFSPGSESKPKSEESDGDSSAKEISNKKGIQSFRSFLASRSNYVKSGFEPNFSGYAGRLENSSVVKGKLSVEEKPESGLSLSPSEDGDLENSEDGSRAKGFGKSKLIFPEILTAEKAGFVRDLKKKRHYQEIANASGFSPSFLSQEGTVVEDRSKLRQQLDLNEGDELASAVSLFALALERVKSKMKSMVRKRSAEILISVAEAIQLQLQTAETQIQADMVKLSRTNKSKRKRLHMRFEELQGELNVIYERFKDEANRHHQDCRYTVEGLNAHQMELKGTLEQQSVSHRKLLLHAEEEIEAQLKDAQRRITEVHNLARKKMFQLKDVMANCF